MALEMPLTRAAAACEGSEPTLSADEALIRGCTRGDEQAWCALIERYKRLIYSIPVRYGFSSEDADDVFQAVCIQLLASLSDIRDAHALPAWLIRTTSHECWHRRKQSGRYVVGLPEGTEAKTDQSPSTDAVLLQSERENILQRAVEQLDSRCQVMIHMLFFQSPARPYREVAEQLGLAAGSIGFMRARCVQRLRTALEKLGFRP